MTLGDAVLDALRDGRAISYKWAVDALAWAVPVAVLLVGVRSLGASSPQDIGPFGLVQALQPALYACVVLLTVSFVTVLFAYPSPPAVLLAAHVAVLVVLLHGAATIVEPVPRFTPAWLHVGFADYIARNGQTLPELDARMSWPGFFALTAMATRGAGLPNAMPLLGWTPVVLNLLYGGAVLLIARATTADRRAAWLALWLFYPANWVGQDYFSPQGLNYLFYLVIVTILLGWFRPPRPRREPRAWSEGGARRLARRLVGALRRVAGLAARPFEHESHGLQLPPWQGIGLVAALVVIFAASTVSHQLSPVAMVASVAGLVLVRRCSLRSLPVLMVVMVAAYFSYLTVVYWSGHLAGLIQSIGNVGGTVSEGATERVQGDAAHQLVTRARVLLALMVWGLAGVGAWRRLRRGTGDFALLALIAAPFLVILLQSYGGEVFLRVYLFALPAAAVLIAGVLLPAGPPRWRWLTATAAVLLSVVLVGAFYLTRYGNEIFEQVRPADVQAMDWVYRQAPRGVTLVAINSNVPWRFQELERYRHTPLGQDLGPQQLDAIEQAMTANPRGAYLILSQAQWAYAESFFGRPPGWGVQLERQVLASGRFRVVYANQGAKILVRATPAKGG